MSRERTHYDECWRNHHKCAIRRITELEAALAERTLERDAAIAERDMTRLYCAEVASYVCNPIYDKVENREGIAADAKAMATGEMVAHYNDIKKQTKRAIRAEAERDAAIRRAEAAEKDAARYRWLRSNANNDIVVGTNPGAIDHGFTAVMATYDEWLDGDEMDVAIDAARAGEEK